MLFIAATMMSFKRLVFPHYSSSTVAFLQDGGIIRRFFLIFPLYFLINHHYGGVAHSGYGGIVASS
jgi:hypothetical protein